MSASHSGQGAAAPYYYVPPHSSHPIQASISMLMVLIGGALWLNDFQPGPWLFLIGVICMLTTLLFWFRDSIGESEGGLNSRRVDHSYRWSMAWFIFSEVMFFGAFFGSLWYTRQVSLPSLTDIDAQNLLWPHFTDVWPNFGPAGTIAPFKTVGPFWLPTINTALLLSSALTLTVAHYALRANHRAKVIFWMVVTLLLGYAFIVCQATEYYHSYTELNLRFDSGAFGSLFYILTGFHGFHVIVGATMLTVITLRLIRGHFTPEHHFGFEGVAWYWHFVDVVWLGLYLFVYWLN